MNTDVDHMMRAIELAARGQGFVEPNPMVGCVIAKNGERIAEGWHQKFGGPHAEIEALRQASDVAELATMYVTLEPCCHRGKTPPCTEAIIQAGIGRVVVAQTDPFPKVRGRGIQQLRDAGITVDVGTLQSEAAELTAPYVMLQTKNRPWVIAKWAMTLDGKIASRGGHSQWISGEPSRAIVHGLRGRVDGIMVGRATSEADNPTLTARPIGARVASRIVLDSRATLSLDSKLVRSIDSAPVLVAVGPNADRKLCDSLTDAGCDVIRLDSDDQSQRVELLLRNLGDRRMTNLLVEGGGSLLGSLFDLDAIDEVHVFIAPKLIGGKQATTPMAGRGKEQIPSVPSLVSAKYEEVGEDIYISGRLRTPPNG